MRIGVIVASSQRAKRELLFCCVKRYAAGSEVFDLGCREGEEYSYIEISILIGALLASGSADLIVTGCSSGQGMMLACNSMPDVLCGYAPTPRDAFLFAQINDGNAVSLPLGEGYTYAGGENLSETVRQLFAAPFGGGWPPEAAARKKRDAALLKEIRRASQDSFLALMARLDGALVEKALHKRDVTEHILRFGRDPEIAAWIRRGGR